MADPLAIVTFGRFAITRGENDMTARVAPNLRRVFAHLLLSEGSRDRRVLAAELWPDETDVRASANLRRRLHELGSALLGICGEGPFVRTSSSIDLAAAVRGASDIARYRNAIGDRDYAAAAALYREPIIPGVDDDWIASERNWLRERHLEILAALIERAIATGDAAAVYDIAQRLLEIDPLSERARQAADVLRSLGENDRARRLLHHADSGVRDEIAFERNVAVTPFFERKRETDAVHHALARGRFVTLVGTPGVGKSRIAMQVAVSAAKRFSDTVRYFDAAAYASADSAIAAFADLLQARDTTVHAAVDAVRSQSMLLVVDNIDAFAAAFEPLLAAVAATMRDGAVLATARAPLHAHGESILTIAPLELPRPGLASSGNLELSPAVAFFLDCAARAGAAVERTHDRLTLVAAICRELDGLPLALDLAARRLRALGLLNLLSLLRDRFRLLDTLRDAYEWSYERLPERDRALFRTFGVFNGPWTLHDACDLLLLPLDLVADTMARLAEASLLWPTPDGAAFTTLRSTREFMRLLLAEHGELDDAERAHMELVLRPLVERGSALRGAHAERDFDDLERRMDELRAAFEAAVVRGRDVELGVRALAALSRFFFERGHTMEGRRWYDEALARLPEPSALRAEARYLRALLGRASGTPAFDVRDFEAAIVELRQYGDETTLAKALLYASNAARMNGQGTYARELATEAERIVAAQGDRYLTGFARSALGVAAYTLGELEEAERQFTAARELYQEAGAVNDEALAIVNAGRCLFGRGLLDAAAPFYREGLALALRSGNRYVEAHARLSCALAALDRGDAAAARPDIARAAEIAVTARDLELSLITLEAAAELWLADGSFERAATALASADLVRNAGSMMRPPTDQRRCDRTRSAAAAHATALESAVRAPETVMRALLAGQM